MRPFISKFISHGNADEPFNKGSIWLGATGHYVERIFVKKNGHWKCQQVLDGELDEDEVYWICDEFAPREVEIKKIVTDNILGKLPEIAPRNLEKTGEIERGSSPPDKIHEHGLLYLLRPDYVVEHIEEDGLSFGYPGDCGYFYSATYHFKENCYKGFQKQMERKEKRDLVGLIRSALKLTYKAVPEGATVLLKRGNETILEHGNQYFLTYDSRSDSTLYEEEIMGRDRYQCGPLYEEPADAKTAVREYMEAIESAG